MHRLHFIGAAICFLIFWQESAWSAELSYAVQGSLTFETHFPDGKQLVREQQFDLRYNSGRWKVTMDLGSNAPARTIIYQYDGTNMAYYAGLFNQASPNLSGRIEEAPAPYAWQDACGWAPWLAYASADYFQSITNGRALSLSFAMNKKGAMKRFDQPVEFSLASEPPHLPLHIRYLVDGFYGLDEDNVTLIPYALSNFFGVSSPFRAGFVERDFEVGGFTNIAGLTFPTTFQYPSLQAETQRANFQRS